MAQSYTVYAAPDIAASGWSIHGEDQQVLHVPLAPTSYVKAERGTMMYASKDAEMEITAMGSGGVMGAVGGALSGDSLFCCKWTNKGGEQGWIGITNNLPAKMIAIDGQRLQQGFTCKRGTWVANIGEVSVMPKLLSNASCLARCCGGMCLIVQGLTSPNPDAWAFIQGCGTILTRELAPGEKMLISTNAILAFSDSIQLDVRTAGGCAMMCCGGEGAFNTELTGPGLVFLQSMPIEKLRRVLGPPPKQEGKKGGDGGGN